MDRLNVFKSRLKKRERENRRLKPKHLQAWHFCDLFAHFFGHKESINAT